MEYLSGIDFAASNWGKRTGRATLGLLVSATLGLSSDALAVDFRPEKISTASLQKKNDYVRDGLVTGGDRNVTDIVIGDIRLARNADYERLVIDLKGLVGGRPTVIPRSSYFQVAISPEEERVTITIWGKPQLRFNPSKALETFAKSRIYSDVKLFPVVEDDFWSFSLRITQETPIEVFELKDPNRIILDAKIARPTAQLGAGATDAVEHSKPKATSKSKAKSKAKPKPKAKPKRDTASEETIPTEHSQDHPADPPAEHSAEPTVEKPEPDDEH